MNSSSKGSSKTTTPETSTATSADAVSMKNLLEADYHGGCTDLFRAIEEMEWKDALNIARTSPEQVKTWIRSVGTENTTFDWSKFRRLPIHEVRKGRYGLIIFLLLLFNVRLHTELCIFAPRILFPC